LSELAKLLGSCGGRLAGTDGRERRPSADELEFSLLGPGYGESAVIHFGHGDWAIVDSCIDRVTRRAAALDYLDLIGVDPSDIRLVVTTHWHDDHIRGISQVLREASKARFVISQALKSDEFLTLIRLVEPSTMVKSSGVREFAAVMDVLGSHTAPTFAIADRRIWRPAGPVARSMWALSPSDGSVQRALEALRTLVEDPELPNRRVPSVRPNDASVALWCQIGDATLLLGADLEDTSDPKTGWRAVVASEEKPAGRADVFKLPHHGALSAHNDDVWRTMVDGVVFAVLTPFSRGATPLPTASDVERICSLAGRAMSTQVKSSGSSTGWDPSVQAVIDEATSSFALAEPPVGHVRLRRAISGGEWSIELFGGAAELCIAEAA
jgi:Metallo-beta-lactamase superfamily